MHVKTVDYHTAGEPFRIVLEGAPPLNGQTILEKRRYAQEHLDEIRKLLVNEPRGHADMYGCFLTEPDDDQAQLGVVFFHNAGYSTACGHGVIALVTWALESGRLWSVDGEHQVVVDVPSGRLTAIALREGANVRSVRFTNVPAFVHSRDLPVGRFRVDVAYGGAFYAILDAAQAGLKVEPRQLPALIELGRGLKMQIEKEHRIVHPDHAEIAGIYGVIFTEGNRNVTVFADGEVDRSPCGSGTSARLALLYDRGEIKAGQDYLHESIIGTKFTGRILAKHAGGLVTEIEGSSFLTGRHEFSLDPDDPLGTGFLLR